MILTKDILKDNKDTTVTTDFSTDPKAVITRKSGGGTTLTVRASCVTGGQIVNQIISYRVTVPSGTGEVTWVKN